MHTFLCPCTVIALSSARESLLDNFEFFENTGMSAIPTHSQDVIKEYSRLINKKHIKGKLPVLLVYRTSLTFHV